MLLLLCRGGGTRVVAALLLVGARNALVAERAILEDWLDGAGGEALSLGLRVLGLFALLGLEKSVAAAHFESLWWVVVFRGVGRMEVLTVRAGEARLGKRDGKVHFARRWECYT